MDRLGAMRVFVTVAESEGFAPAARKLRVSGPAVTRAVAALEDRIGSRLLQRTTRVVRLTEAGVRYLADCKRILREIEEAESSAAGAHVEPVGQIAVTAPAMFGRLYVMPVILAFLERHPKINVRALLVDRVVDLLDEGLDLAVRIAHLPDSTLSAVRVGTVRRVVCASPGYVARHGIPKQPSELSHADAIGFSMVLAQEEWLFRNGKRIERIRPHMPLTVSTTDAAIAAAVAGHGFIRPLSYQIATELRSGHLITVLEDFEPPAVPIHIVHPEGRHANARVRAFIDFAVERLRADEALNPPA